MNFKKSTALYRAFMERCIADAEIIMNSTGQKPGKRAAQGPPADEQSGKTSPGPVAGPASTVPTAVSRHGDRTSVRAGMGAGTSARAGASVHGRARK